MDVALAIALYLIPHAEDWNGKDEVGSYGPYQIRDIYREDVNRFSGCNYTREDCYNYEYAKKITEIYLRHYGAKIGHKPSARDLVRIHNGGPDGWKEQCTMAYWYKCRMYMYIAINALKTKEPNES